MSMPDSEVLAIVALALFVGGAVKGVVGFGIQIVSLAVLTLALDLLTAMAVLLLPTIATNVWQAFAGGDTLALLRRLWPFLLAVAVAVCIGALALKRVDVTLLTAMLGVVTLLYSITGLAGFRLHLPARVEPWLAPLFGAANGLITGMTGASVIPGTLYLQALDFARDRLVQAMGMLYLVSAAMLAVAMQFAGLLNVELGILSLSSILPAIVGMVVGQRIRKALSELWFRRIFFLALLGLGARLLLG
jgi:uncharacterized membrane protein YfcA